MEICCMAQETQTGAVSTWRGDAKGGGREVQEGGAMCVPMVDSC